MIDSSLISPLRSVISLVIRRFLAWKVIKETFDELISSFTKRIRMNRWEERTLAHKFI